MLINLLNITRSAPDTNWIVLRQWPNFCQIAVKHARKFKKYLLAFKGNTLGKIKFTDKFPAIDLT